MSRLGLGGLVPAVALLLVVATAYGVGSYLDLNGASSLAGLAGFAGMILALAACCQPSAKVGNRLVAVGLVAYIVALVACDTLSFVLDMGELRLSIIWLVPLVVGGALPPQRDAWFAAVGCWAMLFGSVVALAYNASHVESGVGFFVKWVS